jgi:indolepyruvate ferredoxin oxidoreductase
MTATPKPDPGVSFTREEGEVHIGGIDALVRLTLDQVRADKRRGLRTAMFVSGYRGSPVGMLDAALLKQQKLLLENNIRFVDGINEDLAATAVWGTQMLHSVGNKKFDGVTGMWYGKAPGVDPAAMPSSTPTTGIDKNGGVLAVVGDDPSCKSLVAVQPVRADAVSRRHTVAVSRQRAGNPRPRPARLPDVAAVRPVGRPRRSSPTSPTARNTTNVSPDASSLSRPTLMFDGKPFSPNMNLG